MNYRIYKFPLEITHKQTLELPRDASILSVANHRRMKLSDEIKSQLIWATVVIVAVVSIPWSISHYYTTTAKAAMEHGYEQGVLPGQQSVYWIKKEAEKP